MRLPIQSQPVQRNVPSQPFAFRGDNGALDGGRGVLPSGLGVQPSGWFDDLKNKFGVMMDGPSLGQLGPFAI